MTTSFDPLTGQSSSPLGGLSALSGLGTTSGAADPFATQFQSLLIQLLTQLLNRLEGDASASSTNPVSGYSNGTAAASATSAAATTTSSVSPVWVLPGPATTSSPSTVQQAYASAPGASTTAQTPTTSAASSPAATSPAATSPATDAATAPASAATTAPADATTTTEATATTPATAATTTTATDASTATSNVSATGTDPAGVMAVSDFPHPPDDNGRGMHWIPTVSQTPAVVDKFVAQAKAMHIKWVTFLNDGTNSSSNDYLVKQLVANGIEPVMRVYTSGLQPISGDLGAMVRHYKALGVNYFQLYNEPNVTAENNGQAPDVQRYVNLWVPAAKVVAENGGYPGFGALSPGGEYKDTDFLSQALDQIKASGNTGVLDHAWLDMHNYQGDLALTDPNGFSRYKVYADIVQQKLGRLMPEIGTEGGTFTDSTTDETQRVNLVTNTYKYMENREPYNFAYSYWVIANQAGGGHDPAWEWQALIHPNGQSPLVSALDNLS